MSGRHWRRPRSIDTTRTSSVFAIPVERLSAGAPPGAGVHPQGHSRMEVLGTPPRAQHARCPRWMVVRQPVEPARRSDVARGNKSDCGSCGPNSAMNAPLRARDGRWRALSSPVPCELPGCRRVVCGPWPRRQCFPATDLQWAPTCVALSRSRGHGAPVAATSAPCPALDWLALGRGLGLVFRNGLQFLGFRLRWALGQCFVDQGFG